MAIDNQMAIIAYKITNFWGAVVEDVRTVFERMNDITLYIPEISLVQTHI